MKRILLICIGVLLILICSACVLNIWIGRDVKENIELAVNQYSGSAEDALISFLLDENNSAFDRTHTAIWTLGRIRSENALPVLNDLGTNDPEGETCSGKHDSLICQYEVHKAIEAIERGWLFSHARFNK